MLSGCRRRCFLASISFVVALLLRSNVRERERRIPWWICSALRLCVEWSREFTFQYPLITSFDSS